MKDLEEENKILKKLLQELTRKIQKLRRENNLKQKTINDLMRRDKD
jgi:prefoldin subunit 5